MANFDSELKAHALLEKVQAYWAERGYQVEGFVEAGDYSPRLRSKVYVLHTNLKNGMPTSKTRVA